MEFLNAHIKLIRPALDSGTFEVYAAELASRIFTTIVKQMKRCQITVYGGFQLIFDFNNYYAWAINLNLQTPEVAKRFGALKELGNLYIVDAIDLRHMIDDHTSSKLKFAFSIQELLELVALRKDWQKIQTKVESSDCCIQ